MQQKSTRSGKRIAGKPRSAQAVKAASPSRTDRGTSKPGRQCSICSDPDLRADVDSMLEQGMSHRRIANELGISAGSVQRHHEKNARVAAKAEPISTPEWLSRVNQALRRNPMTAEQLAKKLNVEPHIAEMAVDHAQARGAIIFTRNGVFHLDDAPALGLHREQDIEFTTDRDGWFTFAASTDQHLCSKYARLDCLNDFYDTVAHREIATVLNAGNWIDGEASFNKHDLLVHGLDNQMQYLAREYPRRAGVTTYAITGADHEGWYARREGVDVGKYAENVMRQNKREDWVDCGYMERYLPVKHYSSGAVAQIHLMHPGGGSAYAISYTSQKIVESYSGGEKPAVTVIGHYHKMEHIYTRNVHAIQAGCFQDQSVFMRQKRLAADVGGVIVKIHLDPETGAVDECDVAMRNYFVRSYYNGRWSQHGPVSHAPRGAKKRGE